MLCLSLLHACILCAFKYILPPIQCTLPVVFLETEVDGLSYVVDKADGFVVVGMCSLSSCCAEDEADRNK